MALTQEQAVSRARRDVAERLGVKEDEVEEKSVESRDFPDGALGAAPANPPHDDFVADELAVHRSGIAVPSSGWV